MKDRYTYDRFIPNRSAMDFDLARYRLTEKESNLEPSLYNLLLAETCGMNRDRMLAFNNRPIQSVPTQWQIKRGKSIPQSPERILDAPWLMDDPYLNLLDWGKNGVSIALGNSLFIWNNGSVDELITYDDEVGPITSVCWAPDGRNIAIGLNSSDVQIWDVISRRKLRTLKGVHHSRVGSLSWNQQILTTGGKDGKICNNDIRSQTTVVNTYNGHNGEICNLKWSDNGKQLASGGTDNLLYIWNLSMSMPSAREIQWQHRFEAHTGAVKALAWCPFQSNVLASGGIDNDRSIKIWNTFAGSCLRSVKTGSEVCSLIWNNNEKELLSSHGYRENQLVLWKYPCMVKVGEFKGHNSRVLYMVQSPDGTSVMSASAEAGEEKLMIWKIFGDSNSTTSTRGKRLADYNFIR